VDCSTVLPAFIDKLAQSAQTAGFQFISSPFFGRPEAAAMGQVGTLQKKKKKKKKKRKKRKEKEHRKRRKIYWTTPSCKGTSGKLQNNRKIKKLKQLV
jgi:hypothetical protein